MFLPPEYVPCERRPDEKRKVEIHLPSVYFGRKLRLCRRYPGDAAPEPYGRYPGVIRVFPAVPVAWQDVSFDKLRAMGAFLVSAEKVAGQVRQVRILPEQGGTLRLAIPEGCKVASVTGNKGDKLEKEGVLILETEKDKTVTVQYN